jgi:hypothetical protein
VEVEGTTGAEALKWTSTKSKSGSGNTRQAGAAPVDKKQAVVTERLLRSNSGSTKKVGGDKGASAGNGESIKPKSPRGNFNSEAGNKDAEAGGNKGRSRRKTKRNKATERTTEKKRTKNALLTKGEGGGNSTVKGQKDEGNLLRTGQQSDTGTNSANGEDTVMTEDGAKADALQTKFTLKVMVQAETATGKQYTPEQLEQHEVGDILQHVTDVEVWVSAMKVAMALRSTVELGVKDIRKMLMKAGVQAVVTKIKRGVILVTVHGEDMDTAGKIFQEDNIAMRRMLLRDVMDVATVDEDTMSMCAAVMKKARKLSESIEKMGNVGFDGITRQALIRTATPFKNELEEIAAGARAVSGQAANGSDVMVVEALDVIACKADFTAALVELLDNVSQRTDGAREVAMIVHNVMSALQSAEFETQRGSEYNTMLATRKQTDFMKRLDTKVIHQFERAVDDTYALIDVMAAAASKDGQSSGLSDVLTEEAEECVQRICGPQGTGAQVATMLMMLHMRVFNMLRDVGADVTMPDGSAHVALSLRVAMMGQNGRWSQLAAVYDVCKRLMSVMDMRQVDESQEDSQSSVGSMHVYALSDVVLALTRSMEDAKLGRVDALDEVAEELGVATENVVHAAAEDDETNEVMLLAAADMMRLLMVIGVHVGSTHQDMTYQEAAANTYGDGWSKVQTLLTVDATREEAGNKLVRVVRRVQRKAGDDMDASEMAAVREMMAESMALLATLLDLRGISLDDVCNTGISCTWSREPREETLPEVKNTPKDGNVNDSGNAGTQSGDSCTYTPKTKMERPSFTDWWQEGTLEEIMSDIARCESKEDAQAKHKEWAWAKKLSQAQVGELFEWLYSRFEELDLPVEFMFMPKPELYEMMNVLVRAEGDPSVARAENKNHTKKAYRMMSAQCIEGWKVSGATATNKQDQSSERVETTDTSVLSTAEGDGAKLELKFGNKTPEAIAKAEALQENKKLRAKEQRHESELAGEGKEREQLTSSTGVKPLQCSLRRVSAMGTPLVQLSHPARLRGAESGTA